MKFFKISTEEKGLQFAYLITLWIVFTILFIFICFHNYSNMEIRGAKIVIEDITETNNLQNEQLINIKHVDSLSHLLGGLWYASILDKNTHTLILKREVKDYTYDFSLKMLADNNFERNKQFIVANDPETSMKGNWQWNADNSLTLNANKQQITLQFLYVDKKEIIIKEIHQPKI